MCLFGNGYGHAVDTAEFGKGNPLDLIFLKVYSTP